MPASTDQDSEEAGGRAVRSVMLLLPVPLLLAGLTWAGEDLCHGEECSGHGTCQVVVMRLAPGTYGEAAVCKCNAGFVTDLESRLECLPAGDLATATAAEAAERETLGKTLFYATEAKKYRALSIAGNVFTDASMALLLSSEVALVFYMLSGFAGGVCDEEAPRCPYVERTFAAWVSQFGAGMAFFAAGFPILDSAHAEGMRLASELPHFRRRIRNLRAAAWSFYGLTMASMTVFHITMPFEGSMWIGALIATPLAIAFAMIAASLNFHAWKLVHRKVREQFTVPQSPKATVIPFISPVQDGVIVGIGGTF